MDSQQYQFFIIDKENFMCHARYGGRFVTGGTHQQPGLPGGRSTYNNPMLRQAPYVECPLLPQVALKFPQMYLLRIKVRA